MKEIVHALLRAIDDKDWDSLSKLLADDTSYEVSGFPIFSGKHAVLDYYENIRPIVSGTHAVESIICEGKKLCCSGRFSGELKNGDKIDVLFADLLEIDNFKITRRCVYYCQSDH